MEPIHFAVSLILTFALTAIFLRFLIPALKSWKLGQKILDIGPRWHKSKEGTPTMGGLAFIAACIVTSGITVGFITARDGIAGSSALLLSLGLALANGAIGVFDDLVKFSHKRNEGLTAGQKYFLQLLVAGLYLFGMVMTGNASTELFIPFVGIYLDLGIFYYVIALLVITGIVNSVNLADGVDGLVSCETTVVGIFFAAVSLTVGDYHAAFMSALLIGACLGFLVYNFPPAKVFMGDTGSLFLGGLLVGLAFTLGNPLIILLAGVMYVVESLSVILQVTSYKLTRKRIFKMSPIHHHFEMCGWSELKIDLVFTLITALACCLAWFGF
ncbi:MAG TPA: phospho-N-acetylmuramoyl-pentapeptide-transferase [Clostridiales bacterium]|nr:phospho-N-acetylmuramoyl-pentapeptide-transferase [Clostridiales bacterium]